MNKEVFESYYSQLITKDGLLPCSQIQIQPDGCKYSLSFAKNKQIAIFASPECSAVCDYLVDFKDLWSCAAIKASCAPVLYGSAPIFGVPFDKAIDLALAQGYAKSKFFLPNTFESGRYRALLVNLHQIETQDGTALQLEVWEYSPKSNYVYYIHALSTDFRGYIYHLDGAIIKYSESDIESFLLKSKKIKGTEYKKYFRLDGKIKIEHMHHIGKAFLPSETLYKEAFEMEIFD